MKINDLFTFSVIESIFNEKAKEPLGSMTKMLYMNVLMGYFSDKEYSDKNIQSFYISFKTLKYDYWKKNYNQLESAGLIELSGDKITFNDVWSDLINKPKREMQTEMVFEMKPALLFKEEILANESLFETLAMKHKLTRMASLKLIELFFSEQTTIGKKYDHVQDCTRHILHWVSVNTKKTNQNPTSSTTKILGL